MNCRPALLVPAALLAMITFGCESGEKKLFSLRPTPGRAEVRLDPIAPRIWRIIDTGHFLSNSLVVETPTSLVMVDTPWTPAATRAVIDRLKQITGKKPEILFLTHFHIDRMGGASVLAEQGVPIVASKATADLLRKRFSSDREELLLDLDRMIPSGADPEKRVAGEAFRKEANEIRTVKPDRIVQGKENHFVVSGLSVDFVFPGPGHSSDNMVVHFPALRLLFAGCLVREGDSLGSIGDAMIPEWHGSVESLLLFDADVVITGHGLRTSPNAILDTLSLLKIHDETLGSTPAKR